MSSYNFATGTTMSGKYVDNWTSGFNRQKYRWKHWSNATGKTLFIPEKSSAERSSVHTKLQGVSGVTRTVGWFGSPNGQYIVTSVTGTNLTTCWSGAGLPSQVSAAPACPAGTTDRFGSLFGHEIEKTTESAVNPYNNGYMSFKYTRSSGGSESAADTSRNTCTTSQWRTYQLRQCYISSQRGNCWTECGGSDQTILFEFLLVGGGGGGTGSEFYGAGGLGFARRWAGGSGGGGFKTGTWLARKGVVYTVTVGGGGSGSTSFGSTGSTTSLGHAGYTLQCTGGGWGAADSRSGNGGNGASGGGAAGFIWYDQASWELTNTSGGSATNNNSNGFPATAGYAGGTFTGSVHADPGIGGGGGGASEAGNTDGAGHGGDGRSSSISGSSVEYGGGGAGAGGVAGAGGGGSSPANANGTAGTTNRGGGGGAGGAGTSTPGARSGGNGGSGVVIIRYPDFYPAASTTTGSPTLQTTGGYRIYTFTGSGSIRWN